MGVRAPQVGDLVDVEESGLGNSLFDEDVESFPAVVGQEPGGAERDDARIGIDLCGRVLLESFVELLGGNEIGGEGTSCAGHGGLKGAGTPLGHVSPSRAVEEGHHAGQDMEMRWY